MVNRPSSTTIDGDVGVGLWAGGGAFGDTDPDRVSGGRGASFPPGLPGRLPLRPLFLIAMVSNVPMLQLGLIQLSITFRLRNHANMGSTANGHDAACEFLPT